MNRGILLGLILATQASADPVFVDRRAGLPLEHVYAGGWEHFVGGGVAVMDCNGDAQPDFLAAGGENPAHLFVNQTKGPGDALEFSLGTLPGITHVTGAYPLDVDGDGHLDLAILRVGPDLFLKGGLDCSFTDASQDWGFAPRDAWTTAFSATWEKGRDWPTLAFGHYVDRADPKGPFEACDTSDLYRPEARRYVDAETIAPGFCTLSMLITDWRRKGEPELRVSNDRHYYVRGGYEQMFRLNPLEERTEDWPQVSLWGMGIASQDLNGDGLPEVMMTSMGDQLLQFNRRDRFENAPFSMGTYAQHPFVGDDGRPSTGWHAEFGDVDNDGRVDLFIAKGNVDQMPSNAIHDPNNLLMQQPDGTFVEKADVAGIATTDRSRGAALADFDGDGRLDLVVVNRRAPLELWQNATPGTGHWAGIEPHLDGNTQAVGAWIELRAGDRVTAREVTVGGGHAGGQSGPVHFGLGAETAAEVRVTWPDGTVSDWTPVPVDRVTEVRPDGLSLRLGL
ncbi:MAG: CRTAC1 family protein [Rhodobacteraceae bacterium]|nr:CRTAC1 family protein [Paracoccaceae bacterium]